MDMAHGGGYAVREIYIPELKMIINHQCAFVDDKNNERAGLGSKPREIEVSTSDEATLRLLSDNLRDRNRLIDMAKNVFILPLSEEPGKVKQPFDDFVYDG